MAEQAQQVPMFKLVLVGDGGTGKVRIEMLFIEEQKGEACDGKQ